MGTLLNETEFGRLLADIEQAAFRLELQPQFHEPCELATVARFTAGNRQPPTEVPELAAWFDLVRSLTAAGRRIERVRVHEDPPTDYQRWERWIGAWNIAAGETLRYLTRAQAHEIGLLPAAGNNDWWLLDNATLIVMTFDSEGRRLASELVDDPAAVAQARTWRDLAVHHSAPDNPPRPGA